MTAAPNQSALTGSDAYFSISTGPTAGTYFPVGSMIATIISHPPGSVRCEDIAACGPEGLIAVALSSRGSVTNVRSVAQGLTDSALAQADIIAWAYGATETFSNDQPMTNLRAIARLYTETVHLVVRRDLAVKSVKDLKGKRISIDVDGSGTNVAARRILASERLGAKSVNLLEVNADRAAKLLELGELDGFFFVGGTPVEVIASLAEADLVDLVPIPDSALKSLQGEASYFMPGEVPSSAYAGIGATQTVVVGAIWITQEVADDDTVYALTRALWDETNQQFFDQGHPQAQQMNLQNAVSGVPIPLHPGAERFYLEQGILPPATP